MIPAAVKNQIGTDIKACIIEEGEDPERCILDAARSHGLSKEQAEEIAENMLDDEEEE